MSSALGAIFRRLAGRFGAGHRRAVRDGLVVAGLVYLAYRVLVIAPQAGTVGADAFAYWALDVSEPYARPNAEIGAFLYSPPMVRAFDLVDALPWPAFWLLWTGVLLATAIWLGGRQALVVIAFPPVALELYYGNVNLLIAAAIALGFRYPSTWAFVLLTKVTPGVGLVWFAVRREWRSLAIALGVTAVIVVISMVADFRLWVDWLAAMTRDAGTELGWPLAIPLWLRMPVAIAVVAWGARRDRPWTVPVAAAIAMPVLWIATLSVLTALLAIQREQLTVAKPR